MNSPKISVLLPVFNAEKYLKECIDSILSQSYGDFELLILDDCSTDRSADIVKSYSDKRIIYARNDVNLGISKTRNKLMKLARGDYWALSDHDDISLPTRLAKQVAFLDENPDCSVVSCWIEFFPEYKLLDSLPEYKFADLIKFKPSFSHPSAMLRGSTIRDFKIHYRDEFRYAEDYDLWFQILKFGKICSLQEVLYKYRWFSENSSMKNRAEQLLHTEEVRREAISSFSDSAELNDLLLRLFMGRMKKETILKKKIRVLGVPIFKNTQRTVTHLR